MTSPLFRAWALLLVAAVGVLVQLGVLPNSVHAWAEAHSLEIATAIAFGWGWVAARRHRQERA